MSDAIWVALAAVVVIPTLIMTVVWLWQTHKILQEVERMDQETAAIWKRIAS